MSRLFLTDQGNGVFSLEGHLTFATIDQQSLHSFFSLVKSNQRVTIDLSEVESIDSAGLALMIEWIKYSRAHDIQLHFKNVPAQLKQLAKLSGLDETRHFSTTPQLNSSSEHHG